MQLVFGTVGFPAAYFEQLAFNVTGTEITISFTALFSGNGKVLKETLLSSVFRQGE